MDATLTIVTPAAGTRAPPGTASRKLKAPAVPTTSGPSQMPIDRSCSVSASQSSRSSGESATTPPNASSRLPNHSFHSDGRNTRS